MAPEQARGLRELTPAADLFSLGCVLYECLTGQAPFVAEHVAAVLVRILFEEPTPLAEVRPDLPAAIAELVQRMLAKPRTARSSAQLSCAVLSGSGATKWTPSRNRSRLRRRKSARRTLLGPHTEC